MRSNPSTRLRTLAGMVTVLALFAAGCSNGAGGASGSSGGGAYGSGYSSPSTPSTSAGSGSRGSYGSYGNGGGSGNGSGGGSGASGNSGGSGATITQDNFAFSPTAITVKSGKSLTVTDANGATSHTFTVQGTAIDVVNDPGQSQHVTIDLSPGTYTFVCRFHATMQGTLTVT